MSLFTPIYGTLYISIFRTVQIDSDPEVTLIIPELDEEPMDLISQDEILNLSQAVTVWQKTVTHIIESIQKQVSIGGGGNNLVKICDIIVQISVPPPKRLSLK